jgi:hypothetical protein
LLLLQKVIHITLAHYKTSLAFLEKESEETVNNNNDNNTEASITSNPITDKISRPIVSALSIKLAYYKQKASFIA